MYNLAILTQKYTEQEDEPVLDSPKCILYNNFDALGDVTEEFGNNWFYTGSFLLDPITANDIDIVAIFNFGEGMRGRDTDQRLMRRGWVRGVRSDALEKGAYSIHDPTIVHTYRKKNINLITVWDEKAFNLWNEATQEFYKADAKELYKLKAERIKLFNYYKQFY